jgi:hypothetical protein
VKGYIRAVALTCSALQLQMQSRQQVRGDCCAMRLSVLCTSVTVLLIAPPPDDDEHAAVGRLKIARGNRSVDETTPMPLCQPLIPDEETWSRTQAALVRSRRLTA